ncbi:1-phosphofructokinase [Macrococcus bovicus]|uniref:Tagatose-6-phosphate kinase n=1 Tax=Macrococcus bovicus TaxID=69968 RepID=A0A4V6PPV1_9STAP|nr:1-phosphofructokinase [Macrococcus bovicus]TDM14638.1 1-phosphofructokinase [Macrococcus bovicus]
MIYTVTLNPSVDYIVFTDTMKIGELNRASQTYKFAGGKGINVSRVLKSHGVESTALGFTGGFPGDFIKNSLQEDRIMTDFIEVAEDTRINIKLKGMAETEINAPGPSVTREQTEQLLQQIQRLSPDDTLVLAGSIPSSVDADIYSRIAQLCPGKIVVDAEKDLLLSVLDSQPEFIKPNKAELEQIFERKLETVDEIIDCARELIKKGAKNVMVSLGGEGALYVSESLVYQAEVPSGHVVNTVGSGDSTVAGMIAGMTQGLSIEESFKLAVASGTATAFTEDLATQEQIAHVLSDIKLTIV